jgi:hypothetical protein
MNDLLRSFGRALVSMLHPRMLFLTFAPFFVATIVWGVILWFSWQTLINWTHAWLNNSALTNTLYQFFDWAGFSALYPAIAPFLVIAAAIPLTVVSVLLLITMLAVPAVISYLSARQFASLELRRGGTWYGSLGHALSTTVICLVLLIITLPLWLIPPFFALIPPVLWGWLTYRVMTYDALALHASADERREIVRRHRWPLLLIGIVSGLLSSLPTFLWGASVWLVVFFPLVTAAVIWVYSLILVFSALWFGHYCLRALERLRVGQAGFPAIPP